MEQEKEGKWQMTAMKRVTSSMEPQELEDAGQKAWFLCLTMYRMIGVLGLDSWIRLQG